MDKPYSITDFKIRREAVKDLKCLAGLDRGCSLTKILYVPKAEKDTESGTYTFRCAVFENDKFEQSLDWLKQEAMLPENGTFHATGAGGLRYKTLISEKLGLDVIFVDEFMTQVRGAQFLIREVDHESLCYPKATLDKEIIIKNIEMMDKMLSDMKDSMKMTENNKFPVLFCMVGSGGALLRLNEDGTASMVSGVVIAGKTFQGLSKCMLGTAKYTEVCDLARAGKRNNIDTEVWEVLQNDQDSPYGSFPPDLPIFSLGKAVDNDKPLAEFKREDVAASLVSLIVTNALVPTISMASILKIGQIYIGGNMMQDEIFRKETAKLTNFLGAGSSLNIHFVKTGHTGAFGAMLSKQGEEMNFITPI